VTVEVSGTKNSASSFLGSDNVGDAISGVNGSSYLKPVTTFPLRARISVTTCLPLY